MALHQNDLSNPRVQAGCGGFPARWFELHCPWQQPHTDDVDQGVTVNSGQEGAL